MTWKDAINLGYLAYILVGFGLAIYGIARPQVLAPLGDLLNYIMGHRITRVALFMVWWWLGWHFLVGVTIR